MFYIQQKKKKKTLKPGVVTHVFNPGTWEAQTGESL